jgi:hypothetical protein
LTISLAESVKLSAKLRALALYKLNKKVQNNLTLSETIFNEISSIFAELDVIKPIKYLGPSSLGDQLAVAISEIVRTNSLIENYQPQLRKISNLI